MPPLGDLGLVRTAAGLQSGGEVWRLPEGLDFCVEAKIEAFDF